MDNDLAIFADSDTFRAYSNHVLQRQMHDAAFARGHGIQPERLAGTQHAFGGNACRHLQFFESQRAVAAAIDVNFLMISRFQPQTRGKRGVQTLSRLPLRAPGGSPCPCRPYRQGLPRRFLRRRSPPGRCARSRSSPARRLAPYFPRIGAELRPAACRSSFPSRMSS